MTRPLLAAIAFSAGLFVGLLIAPTVTATPRAAPEAMGLPTLLGAPLDPASVPAAVIADVRAVGTPSLPAVPSVGLDEAALLGTTPGGAVSPSLDPIGGATSGLTGANDTAAGLVPAAVPLRSPAHAESPGGALQRPGSTPGSRFTGVASWVRASLGSRYLAARLPRGTVLSICGRLGCVTRVVNDWGPDARVFSERVADLSMRDFSAICGDPIRLGVCAVRVTVR